MNLKPIKTEADYRQALAEVERLFNAPVDTTEGDRLEVLTTLIEAYEEQHHPIESPSPYEAILYHLESRQSPLLSFIDGLKQRGVSEQVIQEALNEWIIDNWEKK
ncbi:transcriptional regulator [Phormidium pseudopriestleyi FRX01]|uniref:Transcriptional regulator n=1 Tax=Phormidium pseudopriestleyi FRX01 TaxID=1759528 RepID=A0ABS3FSH3_9CYAN|nr:transcriptional regulator [Phormidium pseudopriestleyi]MBO0349993.1 transcriptional regulator [Phormidium pseudopriestleyi FRX01]